MAHPTRSWIVRTNQPIIIPLIGLSILSLLSSLTAIFFAFFSKNTIDSAVNQDMGLLARSAWILALLLFFQVFLSVLSNLYKTYVIGQSKLRLQTRLFERFLRLSLKDSSKHHTGYLMNHLESDLKEIAEGSFDLLPRLIYYLSRFFGAFIFLFILDSLLASVLLLLGVVLFLMSRLLGPEIKKRHHRYQEAESSVKAVMKESLDHIPLIKAYEAESYLSDTLKTKQKGFFNALIQKALLSVFTQGGLTLFFAIGYGLAIILGSIRLVDGVLSFGALVAIIQLVNHIQSPFGGLAQLIPKYYQMIASAERIMRMDDYSEESKDPLTLQDFSTIEMDHLGFSYDNDAVIHDLHQSIKKGETVLIQGESGKGKTTLFKLLLGLCSPTHGHLWVTQQKNRYPINEQTRPLFAYVPQNHFVLSGTLLENLTFGRWVDIETVIEATKIASIHEDIEKLPLGYHTYIGEKGLGLSEGQLQRLAIARALLKDAPILILDEAFSALDHLTELTIYRALSKLKNKTIILASHRQVPIELVHRVIQINP